MIVKMKARENVKEDGDDVEKSGGEVYLKGFLPLPLCALSHQKSEQVYGASKPTPKIWVRF